MSSRKEWSKVGTPWSQKRKRKMSQLGWADNRINGIKKKISGFQGLSRSKREPAVKTQ